jgi:peptidoglycan/LPS O-acetylase OafA/YrhL
MQWLGGWGVTLFFVLSGFCIHLPFARRLAIDPAAVALALSAVVAGFTTTQLLSSPTPATLIAHVLMVHPLLGEGFYYSINAVFWSIAIELYFYAAYPVLLRIKARVGQLLVPQLLLVALVTYYVGSRFAAGDLRFTVQHFFTTTWWQWAIGVAVAEWYVRRKTDVWSRIAMLPFAEVVWGGASLALGLADPVVLRLHVREWILPVACGLLLASLIRRDSGNWWIRPFKIVGRWSYSLYLVHPIALALVAAVGFRVPLWLRIPTDVAAAIALAAVFYWAVERHFINAPAAAPAVRGSDAALA